MSVNALSRWQLLTRKTFFWLRCRSKSREMRKLFSTTTADDTNNHLSPNQPTKIFVCTSSDWKTNAKITNQTHASGENIFAIFKRLHETHSLRSREFSPKSFRFILFHLRRWASDHYVNGFGVATLTFCLAMILFIWCHYCVFWVARKNIEMLLWWPVLCCMCGWMFVVRHLSVCHVEQSAN